MKKTYFTPETKVMSINCGNICEGPMTSSDQFATDEPCGDAPLF